MDNQISKRKLFVSSSRNLVYLDGKSLDWLMHKCNIVIPSLMVQLHDLLLHLITPLNSTSHLLISNMAYVSLSLSLSLSLFVFAQTIKSNVILDSYSSKLSWKNKWVIKMVLDKGFLYMCLRSCIFLLFHDIQRTLFKNLFHTIWYIFRLM